MRQRSSARSGARGRPRHVRRHADRRDVARAQLLALVHLRGERALGHLDVGELLGHVVGLLLALLVEAHALGLEEIAVGDDGDEGRLEAVRVADGGADLLERVEVGVDGRVDLARLGDEDDDVGSLGPQLEGDRLERARRGVVLGRRRALLDPAGVEDREGAAVAFVVVPAALAGLRRHMPEVGHVRSEERVDERRLARAATSDQDEGGRPLLEQDRPQHGDPRAQVLRHLDGELVEKVLDPRHGAGERLDRVVVGHDAESSQRFTGRTSKVASTSSPSSPPCKTLWVPGLSPS